MTTGTSRRIQTKERLLDAALAVFAERGVGSATVEQVCERAGFTRGAFYSNFESWDELYLAVLGRECRRVGETGSLMLDEVATEQATWTEDRVTAAVSAFVLAAGHDTAHVMALIDLRQHAARNPVLRPGLFEVTDRMRQVLRTLVEQTIPVAGLQLRVAPDLAITTLTALYDAVGVECALTGGDFRERAVRALVEVLRGLLAPAE